VQKAIWALDDDQMYEGKKTLRGIVASQAIARHEGLCLYTHLPYLTHSCVPAVKSLWNIGEGLPSERRSGKNAPTSRVTAARDVKAGEPLTRTYLIGAPSMTRAERTEYLWEHYEFKCNCEVCSLEGDALVQSDMNRMRLRVLREELRDIASERPGPPECLSLALEAIGICVTEYRADPAYMIRAFSSGFEAACVVGDGELARKMMYNILASQMHTEGGGLPQHKTMKDWCINPSIHPVARAFGVVVEAKPLLPVMASVRDGEWASVAEEVGLPIIWGDRSVLKEHERDRRERVRLEEEARKAEAAAKNKEKMLEKRRRKLQKRKNNAKRRTAKQ
ncbi:hypothetical protein KIPB_004845, partial [Kipferlia bialata]